MRYDNGPEVYEAKKECMCGKLPMGCCFVPEHTQRAGTLPSQAYQDFWWSRYREHRKTRDGA